MDAEPLFAAAEKALRSVGIAHGQRCLDFGCGHGNYTIPLARLVGPEGAVYALDKDTAELDELGKRGRNAGLGNIRRMESPGDLRIAPDDGSLDVILLYNVLHSHYFSAEQRGALFCEIDRVAGPEAILSVFPNHVDPEEIQEEVVRRAVDIGFEIVDEYRGPVVHSDGIIEGYIVTFGGIREGR